MLELDVFSTGRPFTATTLQKVPSVQRWSVATAAHALDGERSSRWPKVAKTMQQQTVGVAPILIRQKALILGNTASDSFIVC